MGSPQQTTFTAMRDASREDYQVIGRHSLEWFRDCAEFCEKYDQNSFDPAYDTLPLEAFEPAVRKVFSMPRRSIYVPESAPGA